VYTPYSKQILVTNQNCIILLEICSDCCVKLMQVLVNQFCTSKCRFCFKFKAEARETNQTDVTTVTKMGYNNTCYVLTQFQLIQGLVVPNFRCIFLLHKQEFLGIDIVHICRTVKNTMVDKFARKQFSGNRTSSESQNFAIGNWRYIENMTFSEPLNPPKWNLRSLKVHPVF